MRVILLALACLLLFPSCLSKMEKVAEDTRDQVALSLDRQTGSGVLELFSPDLSPNQKSAAFLRYLTTPSAFPLDKMHVYLGMPKPITEKVDYFIKNETPNVVYLGNRSIPRRLINPMSVETYEAILSSTLVVLGGLLSNTTNYAEYGRDVVISRIVTLAPHILGARYAETNRFYDADEVKYTDPDTLEEKTQEPHYFRTLGASYLMKLTSTDEVSDSLREQAVDQIERLMDITPSTLDLNVKFDTDQDK